MPDGAWLPCWVMPSQVTVCRPCGNHWFASVRTSSPRTLKTRTSTLPALLFANSTLVSGLKGEVAKIAQEQTMDNEYIYAKDLGRAVDLAATVPLPAKSVFNVGAGKVAKFQEIVDLVKRLLPKLQVEMLPGKPPRSAKQPMRIDKAKQLLSWQPEYDLEAGFADYIKELKELG